MRVFEAQYYGTCTSPSCINDKIKPGDEIVKDGGQIMHASCATGIETARNWADPKKEEEASFRVAGKRKPVLCKKCNMEHSGDCF